MSERKAEDYACVQQATGLKIAAERAQVATLETVTRLLNRIRELEALNKDIREDYQQDMKDYGIHNAKKMEAKLKELEAEKDRAQYMICEKHPYLTTTSPTASALGCPYCKLDAVKNLGEQE